MAYNTELSGQIERLIILLSKGNIYNLSFDQQQYILDNNLNASYLLSFDEWNNKGARIYRGSKAIRLPDHPLVFDVDQTNYRLMGDEQFPQLSYNDDVVDNADFDLLIRSFINPDLENREGYVNAFKAIAEKRFTGRINDALLSEINPNGFDTEVLSDLNRDLFNLLKYAYSDIRSEDLSADNSISINDVIEYALDNQMEGKYYDYYRNSISYTDYEEEIRIPEREPALGISEDEGQRYTDSALEADGADVSGQLAESGGFSETGIQPDTREEASRTVLAGNGESERTVQGQSPGDSTGGNTVQEDLNLSSDFTINVNGYYVHIYEGTGDNLLKEDVADGYKDYYNYGIYSDPDDARLQINEIDGGMVLLRDLYRDRFKSNDDVVRDFLENHLSDIPDNAEYEYVAEDESDMETGDDDIAFSFEQMSLFDNLVSVAEHERNEEIRQSVSDDIVQKQEILFDEAIDRIGNDPLNTQRNTARTVNIDALLENIPKKPLEEKTFNELNKDERALVENNGELYLKIYNNTVDQMYVVTDEMREYFDKHPYGSQDGIKNPDDIEVLAKWFNPAGQGTWIATEFDGYDDNGDPYLYGCATLGYDWEWGMLPTFSEMKSIVMEEAGNLRIERDENVHPGDDLFFTLWRSGQAGAIGDLGFDREYHTTYEQEIDDYLAKRGSNIVNSRYRIYRFFTQPDADRNAKASFLKNEFGIGGSSGPKSFLKRLHDVNFDSKGISFNLYKDTVSNETVNYKYKWPQVADRIQNLVDNDNYLSKDEMDAYQRWLSEQDKKIVTDQENEEIEEDLEETLTYTDIYSCWNENDEFEQEFDTLEEAKKYAATHDYVTQIRKEHTWEDGNGNMGADDVTIVWDHGFNIDVGSLVISDKQTGDLQIIEKNRIAENSGQPDFYFEGIGENMDRSTSAAMPSVIVDDDWKKEHLKSVVIDLGGNPYDPDIHDVEVKPYVEPINYHISDEQIGVGAPLERFSNNVRAIELLRRLESEDRNATADEQDILAKYVGWGGLADFFDESKRPEQYRQLKNLLTDSEYASARESTLSAFYTQPIVIDSIYRALDRFGFKKGNILEPSCGVGNFFGRLPETMLESSLYGVELDSISSRIARKLYPNADIQTRGYETTMFDDNFFDVAIGNVPFGDFSVSDKRYDKYNFRIHDYFFAKTIDKVKTGGVIALITSKGTMDKLNSKVREYIDQRCDLIGAIRLPKEAFKSAAGTETVSDIIFLSKRETPRVHTSEWVNSSDTNFMKIDYFDRYMSKEDIENEVISLILNGNYEEYNRLARYCRDKNSETGQYGYVNEIRDSSATYPYQVVDREYITNRWSNTWTNRYGSIKSTSTYRCYGNELIELYKWFREDPDTVTQYVAVSGKFNSRAKTNQEKYDMAYEYLTVSDDAIERRFKSEYVNQIVNALTGYASYLDQKQGQYMQPINTYYASHKDMIVGEPSIETSRFGYDFSVSLDDESELSEKLNRRVDQLSYEYKETEQTAEKKNKAVKVIPANMNIRNYSYGIVNDEIYYRTNSTMEQIPSETSSYQLLKDLINLNTAYKDLIQSQLNGIDDEGLALKQKALTDSYDSFVAKHGRIFKLAKAMKPFVDNDATLARVESLEVYDVDKKEFLRRADIFSERTIHSQEETIEHCETSFDALLVSLRTHLNVDLELMSKLTDKPQNEIISDLKGSIYRNHLKEDEFISADEYLSGNVREKFKEVTKLYNDTLRLFQRSTDADEKERLQQKLDWLLENKKALEDAQPVDLQPYEIDMPLGASWIPTEVIQQFAEEVILDGNYYSWNRPKVKRSDISKNWYIENKTKIYDSVNLTELYGLPDRGHNALDILESCLNLKREEVAYYVEDDRGKKVRVVDKKKTLIAIQKQDLIKREFSNWLKENEKISKELADIYNDKFNCIVDRKYNPDLINPVGLSNLINGKPIELYTHQKEAIAKALFGGNIGVFHSVGAGKTLTLITIAMESKRLGLCNKSLFVVPKAITGQWGRDFINAYPNANVLVADEKSFTKENRRRFISKIASGNYDAIIISNEQFKLLKLSDERVVSYIQEDIDRIQEFLEENRYRSGRSDWSVKQAESIKKKLETRIQKRNEMKKDDFIDFEELGIDKLFIDESHNFKNLAFETSLGRIKGIGSSADAQKSNDLYYKTRYLNQLTNNRGIVFATGTPISNYLAEMFTIQRYLQPDTLRYMDVDNFDSWVSVFGEIVEEQQLDVTGTKYTPRAVLKRYHNLPELMGAFRQVADIRTKDTLDLDLPDVQRINVEVKRTDEQKEYLDELNERLDRIRNNQVDPTEDNMLLITNDGRKMALDQRLVGMPVIEDEKVKADYVSENVYKEYINSNDIKGTQAIFSDLSTPDDTKWNIYKQIKDNLVAKGIPEAEIQFIHDYEKQKDKEKLFKMINEGTVRVILGSTSKLGTGVNMQERMVALHHIDVPWKPSDIEQREGRAVRQGNINDEVKIYRYITADTFDAYSWQIIENKATFISQIMTNRNPARSCDDLDDDGVVLDAAQIKAIATGNPLIKERMTLENDIKKLTISKQEYLKGLSRLKENITISIPQDIAYRKDNIARLENDMALYHRPKIVLTEDGKQQYLLDIEVNGQKFTDYKLAGEELQKMAKLIKYPDDRLSPTYQGKVIGKYQDFEIKVAAGDFLGEARYVIGDKWSYVVNKYESPTNMTRNLISKLDELPQDLDYQKEALKQAETNLENSRRLLDKPFEFEEEPKQKQIRLNDIIESMDHEADYSSEESLEGKTLYDEKGNVITNDGKPDDSQEEEYESEDKEL